MLLFDVEPYYMCIRLVPFLVGMNKAIHVNLQRKYDVEIP